MEEEEEEEKRDENEDEGDKEKEVKEEKERGIRRTGKKKDGPGPVMVSDTLCPAVHILGT